MQRSFLFVVDQRLAEETCVAPSPLAGARCALGFLDPRARPDAALHARGACESPRSLLPAVPGHTCTYATWPTDQRPKGEGATPTCVDGRKESDCVQLPLMLSHGDSMQGKSHGDVGWVLAHHARERRWRGGWSLPPCARRH